MCEEIDDSERQFTEQDLNDAFKAGMRWLKFNYTENWDDGYVDDWRDFIGKKRKTAKANGTKEEAGRAASDVNARVIRLWKLEECGETFTILARSEEKAKSWYKRHLKDISVPVSDADIDSVEPVPFDEVIRVNYPDHGDVEVALKAEQWVALCDTMGVEWNILCSSAWV